MNTIFEKEKLKQSLDKILDSEPYRKAIEEETDMNTLLNEYLVKLGFYALTPSVSFAIDAFRTHKGIPHISKSVYKSQLELMESYDEWAIELCSLKFRDIHYYALLSKLDEAYEEQSASLAVASLLMNQYLENQEKVLRK